MEFNKIFAAILTACIVAMLSGFIAKKVIHKTSLEQDSYVIEVAETDGAGGAPVVKGPEPILALLAEADIARGEKLSKACAACHSFEKGGPNKVGPNLWNSIGAPIGTHAGFSYSAALQDMSDQKWTYENMNAFLWKPKDFAPGTKMSYIGMKKPQDRAAMIAWLRTLNDNPPPLPDVPAEEDVSSEEGRDEAETEE